MYQVASFLHKTTAMVTSTIRIERNKLLTSAQQSDTRMCKIGMTAVSFQTNTVQYIFTLFYHRTSYLLQIVIRYEHYQLRDFTTSQLRTNIHSAKHSLAEIIFCRKVLF